MSSRVNPTASPSTSNLSPSQLGDASVKEGNRSSSVLLDQETCSRMGLRPDSLATKVLRFFRSIAEALKLRRPSSTIANAQQETAAARFNSLAREGGGMSPHQDLPEAAPEKTETAQGIDAKIMRQSAFEKTVMQAFEQTKIRPRCEKFCHAVKEGTDEDISQILQRKGVKKNDSAPESRTFTALPPWMEYQNNLRALARMRSEAPETNVEHDLEGMTRVAAELTPSRLELSDHELQPTSRRYRDAGNHLSGFLRSCMSEDSDRNLKIAARHFQSYQSAVDANLSNKPEVEKDMVHDLLLDGALKNLTLKERNLLADALKADDAAFGHVMTVFEAERSGTAQKILSAMKRHVKTGPFMPQQGFSSRSTSKQEEVRQAFAAAQSAESARMASAARPAKEETAVRAYKKMVFSTPYSNLTAAEKPLVDAGNSLANLLEISAHDDDSGKTELALNEFADLVEKMHQESRQPTAKFRLSVSANKKPDQESVRFLSSALRGRNEKGMQLMSDALFDHAWGRLPSQKKGAFLESLRRDSSGIERTISKPHSDYERHALNRLITSMKNHPDVSSYVPAHMSAYNI